MRLIKSIYAITINELIKSRFNKGLRSNLFYWRDVSGHEVDIVADHGSYAIGMELKSGMIVIPDFLPYLWWRRNAKKKQWHRNHSMEPASKSSIDELPNE